MSDDLGDFEDVTHEDGEDFDSGESDDEHRLDGAEPSEQPDDTPRDDNEDPVLPDDDSGRDTNHNLNESADKIRVETDLTRGAGTRDQEKHKLKARGETPEEAAENLSETLRELEERGVFERTRALGGSE